MPRAVPGTPITAQPQAQASPPLVPTTAGDERKLPIVAVDDHDPSGGRTENDLAKYALDQIRSPPGPRSPTDPTSAESPASDCASTSEPHVR